MNDVVPRMRVPIFDEQVDRVVGAVRRGQLVLGPHLEELECALRAMIGKRYVALTANGFSALFATLKAIPPGNGRVVTAPASTCFAMVNAIKAAELNPVFVDMDDASASLANCDDAPGAPGSTAIVPDHFGIIAPACRRARAEGGLLIEDAAQSFLSRTHVQTAADVVVLSLYPSKQLNGIDGGAVLTDDEAIFRRVMRLISYGDQVNHEDAPRYNLKMNNVNAAFALGTLARCGELLPVLRTLHARLSSALAARGVRVLAVPPEEVPSRLIIIADGVCHRSEMMQTCLRMGVEAARELMPVCPPETAEQFPGMRRLVENSFSLPFHSDLGAAEIDTLERAIACL
jgi:dTDP-4-amino-4,6-dideoxygalactose transaminase